MGAGRITGQ